MNLGPRLDSFAGGPHDLGMSSCTRSLDDLQLPHMELHVDPWVVEEVHRRTRSLADRFGLFEEHERARTLFERGHFALLASLAYAESDVDIVTLCNDFNTYLFFVDDRAEENEDYGKRPELLRLYFESHAHLMRTGEAPWEEDPAVRLLADVRRRLRPRVSTGWLARFASNLREYLLKGTLVGAEHWTAGTVPTLRGYLDQRAWDSAVFCSQDLLELYSGEIPAGVRESDWFQEARRLCTRVVAFTNDLVSYAKEVVRNESPNNLVYVLMCRENLELDEAVGRAIDIVNDDALAFAQLMATRPQYEESIEAQLAIYRRGQEAWMRGNLLWSLATGRYVDPRSPFAELREYEAPELGEFQLAQ